MPVDITSRYRGLPIAEAADPKGSKRPTIALRPAPAGIAAPFSHRLITLETLELIAFKYYNNSAYWWRIADVNPRVFPLDWNPGDMIRLPGAGQAGLVQRTRNF